MATSFRAFPVDPVAGLSLRGLRRESGDRTQVSILRIRAQISAVNTGFPTFSFTVPGLDGRAIIAASALPFQTEDVGDPAANPTVGDTNVVRPIFAIRGPDSLEMALLDNDNMGWPGAMAGTLIAPAFGEAHHYQDQEAWEDNAGLIHALYPTRVTFVRDKGVDPANPTANHTYAITLASGQTISVSLPIGTEPALGSPFPPTQEVDRFPITVGTVGKNSQDAAPARNAYTVPIKGDDDGVLSGPHNQEQFHDTITAVRTVFDLPDNPSVQVKEVTLMSGANVRVALNISTIIGAPLSDPSAVLLEGIVIDPNQYWEFDVILVHQEQRAIDADLVGDAAIDVSTAVPTLNGMQVDAWPIFPNDVVAT